MSNTESLPSPSRFSHRLRVRWSEVDMQKIVFNAHYLAYFDVAIAEYWRALAMPYEATMQQLQGDIYLKKATVEYHASARVDDIIDITLRCAHIGRSSLRFDGQVLRDGRLLTSGELLYVYADPKTQTSQAVPDTLRGLITGYEAGEPVLNISLGDWATLGADASSVREQVFVQEQGIPKEMEWDEADAQPEVIHALARNRLGHALATGRLLQHAPGVGRIGRMAVLQPLRGTGLGEEVLEALVQASAKRGDLEVLLHAQLSAEGFYRQAGFTPRGEVFTEAGIGHQEMFRVL